MSMIGPVQSRLIHISQIAELDNVRREFQFKTIN